MRVSYCEDYFVPLPDKHPFPMGKFPALQQILLGELAKEGLLASQRVVPKALLSAGFSFEFADLSGALRQALKD